MAALYSGTQDGEFACPPSVSKLGRQTFIVRRDVIRMLLIMQEKLQIYKLKYRQRVERVSNSRFVSL